MKIVHCKKCNKSISSTDPYCINCGTSRRSMLYVILRGMGLLTLMILSSIFLFFLYNSDGNNSEIHYPVLNQHSIAYDEIATKFLNKEIPYSQYEKIGYPETMSATGIFKWVAYFPKADFTIVSDKTTDIIEEIYLGRRELGYGIHYGE